MNARTTSVKSYPSAKDQLCAPHTFTWGHVSQLEKVQDELLRRAWAAGAGPGADPVCIDVDSTICETYGLQ